MIGDVLQTLTSWTTQYLVAFLGDVSAARDEMSAMQTAAEGVAIAADAEIGAVITGGVLRSCIGFGRSPVPTEALLAACHDPGVKLVIPGVGEAEVLAAELGRNRPGHLLTARVEAPFAAAERGMVNAMADVLGLALDVLSALESERAARRLSEQHTRQMTELLRALRAQRQVTLDRFSRIQHLIADRDCPLEQVLDEITAAAGELVECDVAVLRVGPEQISTYGLDDVATEAVRSGACPDRLGALAERRGAAVADNAVAVESEFAHYGTPPIRSAVAVPVLLRGSQTIGHLLLASRHPDHRFTTLEEALATSLAEHAGLAVQDAQTVDALREALTDAQHRASHDALTGLANRATFLAALEAALAHHDSTEDETVDGSEDGGVDERDDGGADDGDDGGVDDSEDDSEDDGEDGGEVTAVAADPTDDEPADGRRSTPPKGGSAACVLYIDLDYFKQVNDTHGHLVGDQLLVVTASRLRHGVREGDLVARLGGDEFAVLLTAVADEHQAHQIAQRLYAALTRPAQLHGESVWPSASIGVATAVPEDTPTSVLARADLALYEAKRRGRGQVAVYRPGMGESAA